MSDSMNIQGAQVGHSRYHTAGAELSSQQPRMAGPMGAGLQHMQMNQLNSGAHPVDIGSAGNPLVQLTNALVSVLQTLVEVITSMFSGGSTAGPAADGWQPIGAQGNPPAGAVPTSPAEVSTVPEAPMPGACETGNSSKSKGGFGDMFGGLMEKLGGLFGGLFGGGKSEGESGGGFMDKLGGLFGGILGGGKSGGGIIEKGLSLFKGFF